MKIKELRQQWKENHIKALESMGFNRKFWLSLRRAECKARNLATLENNGNITSESMLESYDAIETRIAGFFGGNLPSGFFMNSDSRGTCLKIDDSIARNINGLWRDMGGYGVLAPDFSEVG